MSDSSELDRNDFSYMSDEQFEHFRNRMLVHRLFGIVEYLETGRYVTQTHFGIFFETLTEFFGISPENGR